METTPQNFEKAALQVAVAVAACVPVGAGVAGMLLGPWMVEINADTVSLDSHFRYLSGLLLAIGLGYVTTIQRIEHKQPRFFFLTCLVFVGGIGRLISVVIAGTPSASMQAALVMELVITPALALWQARVARRMSPQPPVSLSG